MRIKEHIFKEWIKRLRSGEYTKIKKGLVDPLDITCRCAAGVMLNQSDLYTNDNGKTYSTPLFSVATLLAAITLKYGEFHDYVLYDLNDDTNLNFEEIALILEENQKNGTFGELRGLTSAP